MVSASSRRLSQGVGRSFYAFAVTIVRAYPKLVACMGSGTCCGAIDSCVRGVVCWQGAVGMLAVGCVLSFNRS
jgi:hypothetical protein